MVAGKCKCRSMSFRKFLKIATAMVMMVILTLLCGCFGNSSNSKEKLDISDVTMSVEYNQYFGYSVKINGTAKNSSGKNYSYASVEYSIYDDAGNNLGMAMANISHLENGDSWKFSAILLDFAETKPS